MKQLLTKLTEFHALFQRPLRIVFVIHIIRNYKKVRSRNCATWLDPPPPPHPGLKWRHIYLHTFVKMQQCTPWYRARVVLVNFRQHTKSKWRSRIWRKRECEMIMCVFFYDYDNISYVFIMYKTFRFWLLVLLPDHDWSVTTHNKDQDRPHSYPFNNAELWRRI